MDNKPQPSNAAIDNPPGGLVVWILVVLELLTFGIALVIMAYMARSEQTLFRTMAAQMNLTLGALNTLVLLSSGFAMALSVHYLSAGQTRGSDIAFFVAMVLGLAFLVIKGYEYQVKIREGLTLGQNTYIDFYWLLTGFHGIHVWVGMVILGAIRWSRQKQKQTQTDAVTWWESGAAFWHLCDLIWLLLFPCLYIIYR